MLHLEAGYLKIHTAMVQFIHQIGLIGVFAIFFALIVGIVLTLKLIMERQTTLAIQAAKSGNVLEKKYEGVDLNNYKGLIRNLSFILALGLVIAIFEFPHFDDGKLVSLQGNLAEIEEMQEVPPTEQTTPPPPVMRQPEIVEVADDEEIELEMKVNFDMEATESSIIEEVTFTAKVDKEEEVDEVFEIVEETAAPVGGYEAFYAYVGKTLKYPRQAINVGAAGKVYVRFIIEKDGSITNVETIRGIGFGCDDEAVKVVAASPRWNPGKQRGRPVKQRMVIPIAFKLSDI
jgi:protein TonB